MPDTTETLIKRNLHEVFGERDTKKRREAIAQLWTEDCVFIDHSGKSHGRDELDRAVAALAAECRRGRSTPESRRPGRRPWIPSRDR